MCDESCDFVSKKCAIESFIAEHTAEPMYQSKLQELTPRYSAIRRTRADGSCFYRGLAFAYLESMLGKRAEIQRFRERLMESRNELLAAGFQKTSFGDGYGAFLRVVDSAQTDDSGSALLRSFNHSDVSDGVVRYLRLVTSAFLRNRADFYQPFVAEGLSIDDFCAQHVEPMSAVCDHIHVSALTEALAIPLQVEYADSAHSAVTPLVFPAGSEPSVYMLYKQDHYTVLYRGAEP